MAWRQAGANRRADRGPERLVEGDAACADDEQHERAGPVAARVLEVHDEAVGHAVDVVDDPVDLCGAHTDAAAVERGVGPAGDDARAARGDRDPVAVAPNAGIFVEVSGAVPRPVSVTQEPDRHRRHRSGDHQLALLVDHRPAGLVERLDVGAEIAARDLPCPYRGERIATDERRADVGATADRRQHHVGLHGVVHPVELIDRQRRPGRAHGAKVRQVELVTGAQTCATASDQIRRTHPEPREAELRRDPP